MWFELVPNTFEQTHPELLVRHFAPTKAQRDLGFITFRQESNEIPELDLVIAFVSAGPKFDFLDLDLLQLESGFVLFLGFPVFEFAEIHDPANGRLGHRRDLDQVEFSGFRTCACVDQGNDSELLTIFTNQADFGGGNFRVDPLMLFESYCLFSNVDKKRPCPEGRVAA